MTAEEFEAETAKIRARLLEIFHIGSEWYDCEQDDVGKVALHFPPKGIVMKMTTDYGRYPFSAMLTGQLIPCVGAFIYDPADKHPFFVYQKRLKAEAIEYNMLVGDLKIWA